MLKGIRHRIRLVNSETKRKIFYWRLGRLGVELGEGCRVRTGSSISPNTRIGPFTAINGPCVLKGGEPIVIGKYCAIGDGVRMISSNHGTDWVNLQNGLQRRLGFPYTGGGAQVTVGNNVWIGDAAIILSGVTVGDGAVIGAGSIVTKDVPAFGIAVGSPARVVRMRFSPAVIDRLSELEWWEWSEDEMRGRPDLFGRPISGEQEL